MVSFMLRACQVLAFVLRYYLRHQLRKDYVCAYADMHDASNCTTHVDDVSYDALCQGLQKQTNFKDS